MSSAQNAAFWGIQNAQNNNAALLDRLNFDRSAALNEVDTWQPSALAALTKGYADAGADYNAGISRLDPYVAEGSNALGALSDATGANGAAGSDRAAAAFRTSPGYQWNVDQSLDQVNRKASATGSLGSGNTLTALQDRASNLADQEYGSYVGRLQGLTQLGYGATAAQAGIDQGLGQLDMAHGSAVSDLLTGNAARKAGIWTGTGAVDASSVSGADSLEGQLALAGGQAADKERDANSPINMLLGLAKTAASLGGAAIGKWG